MRRHSALVDQYTSAMSSSVENAAPAASSGSRRSARRSLIAVTMPWIQTVPKVKKRSVNGEASPASRSGGSVRNAASISTHSPKLEHSTTITGRSKACAKGSIDMGMTSAVIDSSLPHSGSGRLIKLWLACRGAYRGTADMRCSSARAQFHCFQIPNGRREWIPV